MFVRSQNITKMIYLLIFVLQMDTLKVTDHSQAIDPTTGGFDKKITMTEDV